MEDIPHRKVYERKEREKMAAKHGSLSINSDNIFPIIKKWLYSDHDIFFRELISNGCDAITKLKKLDMMGEYALADDYKAKIQVIVNPEEKTITFTDNGLGMTAEEVKEYINQIAFSGATDFLAKYKDKTNEDQIIGHFGLGFECYTHFTSPIRRYSDIIVHRILKAILHKQKNIEFLTRDLEIISTMLNAQEKHFTHIEHKFFMLKMCRLCEELLAKGRIITQGIVIDELSHCIALEKLPQAKITLDCSLKRFSRVNIEIVDVDLAKGSIYARVI